MKKLAYLAGAMALCTLSFISCEKDKGKTNLDDVTEDGFYVAGPATGASDIAPEYMMTAGINEVDGNRRDGMFEKYVALKGGQDFELLLYSAGTSVRYSAELADMTTDTDNDGTPGDGDQPTITLKRGVLVTGADAPAMQVESDGLYHIVLDLNKNADLSDAQIIVAPVTWGVRGINSDWGWKEMTVSGFDQKTMTWTTSEYELIRNCDFKFSYGGGWKIQLDDAGNVKAHTNLGLNMENGGGNIPTGSAYKNAVIVLTWKLSGGEIKNGYSFEIKGEKTVLDPKTYSVGFAGGCFDAAVGNWVVPPVGAAAAVCDEDACIISDQTTLAGTYVYNIEGLVFRAGEFKVIFDGGYFGAGSTELKLSGINFTGTDNFVITAAESGTYNAKFTIKYDGSKATEINVVLTKTGKAPVVELGPEDLVIGISGSFGGVDVWTDPEGSYRAVYDKSASDESARKYVYRITGFELKEGDQFKFRFNGSWEGVGFQPLEGITLGDTGGNFTVGADAAGTYDITFSCVWDPDSASCTDKAVTFTKK